MKRSVKEEKMSEEMIVQHCAPTLAGMKTGNLFSCPYQTKKELQDDIRRMNHLLGPKGVRVLLMRCMGGRALIYLYRPGHLRRDFSDKEAAALLSQYGYAAEYPERCLARLAGRLRASGEFPHEIGLFLGYPPEDVRGFIENKAAGCKCVGCWKVYGDEEKAKQTFCRYRRCTDIYCDSWAKGMSVERLTVTV
jgi:hypothetical protein